MALPTSHQDYTVRKLERIRYYLEKYMGRMDLENNTLKAEADEAADRLKAEIDASIARIKRI
ncbi:MAG: hypothetical protein FWH40_07045 [Coriobacteriia bacterium]|nr:hypothetical protein [Coriobacteriia bacterium]